MADNLQNSPSDDGKEAADGKPAASDLIPPQGEHSLSIGQNGSGKTMFNVWMLERVEHSPIVIYDTKEDDTFMTLPNKSVVTNFDNVRRAVDNDAIDYVVFRPPVAELADPDRLDEYLYGHYQLFHNVPAYIDEIYTFHRGGRSGPGLSALLTRGRSKGISTLMSTQRPRYLTNFALSEAKRFYVFKLTFKEDRKRLADIIPGYEDAPEPDKYGFLFYKSGADKYQIYKPVDVSNRAPQTYTDQVNAEQVAAKHTWLR